MLEIQNAVAVITGGASGIGLATARYWLQQGGKVVIGDISEDALGRAIQSLEGDVVSVVVDVTREEDGNRLAARAIDAFGRIDLVAPFACELFRNEALTGDVFYIHGGLRLGSRG